jgi:hypothetical protein
MRKLSIAAVLALTAVLAVAGIAYATNTYVVDLAKSKSTSKGSLKKPSPASFDFGYGVGDTEDLRPQVITKYFIGAEGLETYPKAFPSCKFADATNPNAKSPSALSAKCRRAIIGSGTIHNEAGAPNDRTQKLTCDVLLTLINISTGDPVYPETVKQIKKRGGIAIRIDQYQKDGQDDPAKCPPVDLHQALAAPYYDVKIGGVKSAELRFNVPVTLAHPGGLDNSVKHVVSHIRKKTAKARVAGVRRTVGFYSAVGRKGKTRTVRVTYVDESGHKATATKEAK